MRVAVVTGIFSPKSKIEIKYSNYFDEYDYFCYTCDSENIQVDSKITRIVLPNKDLDKKYSARRVGKIPKMLSHLLLPNYDIYIWCDATHEPCINLKELKDILGNNDCALFKHPHRNCVYEEAAECSRCKLDHQDLIDKTVYWLSSTGFPRNCGLYEMTSFIRKNNKKCNDTFSLWYSAVSKLSSRDQLSFMPCAYETNVSIKLLEGSAQIYFGGNKYFKQIKPSLRVSGVIDRV